MPLTNEQRTVLTTCARLIVSGREACVDLEEAFGDSFPEDEVVEFLAGAVLELSSNDTTIRRADPDLARNGGYDMLLATCRNVPDLPDSITERTDTTYNLYAMDTESDGFAREQWASPDDVQQRREFRRERQRRYTYQRAGERELAKLMTGLAEQVQARINSPETTEQQREDAERVLRTVTPGSTPSMRQFAIACAALGTSLREIFASMHATDQPGASEEP